jgi:hypothetical protein
MKFYGIANSQGTEPIIHIGEGLPDLLVLDHQGKILPVFGRDDKLQAFVRAHPFLQAYDYKSVETALLGDHYLDVAEKISPAVEAGRVELIVFDPVLNTDGAWVDGAFESSLLRLWLSMMKDWSSTPKTRHLRNS